MKSSSGEHYIALDHLRALAAFLVFNWHFIHFSSGFPIPFEFTPRLFPFALLDEGHTGVALFMALSGYLFAKLLDGKKINYQNFFLNRVLRLIPLLVIIFILAGIKEAVLSGNVSQFLKDILLGFIFPRWPNGGWSITIEFQFYFLLPFLLYLVRKSKYLLGVLVLAALALRSYLFFRFGSVQLFSFFMIIGRIDQFLFGILAYHFRSEIIKRHFYAILLFTTLCLFYFQFDKWGGYYQLLGYPSKSPLWIILPTVEGFLYSMCIAYYDGTFSPPNKGVSRFFGIIGNYSYAIYLFHFFIVFEMARLVHVYIMDLSNFYVACVWSFICFMGMIPIGYLSFKFIENPFIKRRKKYIEPATL